MKASVQLQYHIDLFSACRVEGDRHGLSYDKCRRDLQQREQAWHTFRWRRKVEVNLQDFDPQNLQVELVGDSLYVLEYSEDYQMFQRAARAVLPPSEDDEEARWQPIWEELDFDIWMQAVCTDVAQDLLVLVEYVAPQ